MAPCALCDRASPRRALLKRPKTLQPVCKECFYRVFETEIHNAIMGFGQAEGGSGSRGKPLFRRGEKVAIGASGGKGSQPTFLVAARPGRLNGGGQTRPCWRTS